MFGGKYREVDENTKVGGVNVIGNVILSDDEKKILENNKQTGIAAIVEKEKGKYAKKINDGSTRLIFQR